MRNLIALLARYHVFLLFLFLEIVCLLLIVRFNSFQGAGILNSCNVVAGSLLSTTNQFKNYIALGQVNRNLTDENAQLRSQIKLLEAQLLQKQIDSICKQEAPAFIPQDSLNVPQYTYIGASVINNTTNKANNYITINKGAKHGIKPEMAVIGRDGVVGIVKNVSDNFATIISLLHKSMRISAKIKENNYSGSLQWDVLNPRIAVLDDIPIHATVNDQDSILTSGYSSFFPPNVPIGVVSRWASSENTSGNFYDIKVTLSTNFSKLSYVYVIDYKDKNEQKKLEKATNEN